MQVPKLLAERHHAAARTDLSPKIVKELRPVEAVSTMVLGDLTSLVNFARKPRLLIENAPPVISLSRGK